MLEHGFAISPKLLLSNFLRAILGMGVNRSVKSIAFRNLFSSVPFQNVLRKHLKYFRYIDDALLIYFCNAILNDLVNKLKKIKRTIKLTHEAEINSKFTYIDEILNS